MEEKFIFSDNIPIYKQLLEQLTEKIKVKISNIATKCSGKACPKFPNIGLLY